MEHRGHHIAHKDHTIVVGAVLLAVVGLPVFLLARNSSSFSSPIVINDVHPAAVVVPFTELTEGTQSVVARRVNYVLKSPEQLSELWQTIDAPGVPPDIDFNTHAVIAVFAGSESSTSIAVERIEDSKTRLVSIAIAEPTNNCSNAQGGSPYQIVAVPATSLSLEHEDVPMEGSCPK